MLCMFNEQDQNYLRPFVDHEMGCHASLIARVFTGREPSNRVPPTASRAGALPPSTVSALGQLRLLQCGFAGSYSMRKATFRISLMQPGEHAHLLGGSAARCSVGPLTSNSCQANSPAAAMPTAQQLPAPAAASAGRVPASCSPQEKQQGAGLCTLAGPSCYTMPACLVLARSCRAI